MIVHYFSDANQIVDWYHAKDRLKRIAEEALHNLEEHQAWLKRVIEACQPLAKRSFSPMATTLNGNAMLNFARLDS